MPASVTIQYVDRAGSERRMTVTFGDDSLGMRRCLSSGTGRPGAEPDPKFRLRLLGAAFIDALEQTPERDTDLTRRAVEKTEEAVMLAVKALYEAGPAS